MPDTHSLASCLKRRQEILDQLIAANAALDKAVGSADRFIDVRAAIKQFETAAEDNTYAVYFGTSKPPDVAPDGFPAALCFGLRCHHRQCQDEPFTAHLLETR